MISFINNLSIRSKIVYATTSIIFLGYLGTATALFLFSANTTNEYLVTASKEVNNQIVLNYEQYVNEIVQISNTIVDEIVVRTKTDDYEGLQKTMNVFSVSNDAIYSMYLVDLKGDIVVESSKVSSEKNMQQVEGFSGAFKDEQIFYFSSLHLYEDKGTNQNAISVSKVVDYYENEQLKTGVMIIEVNTRLLKDLSEVSNLGEGGHIVIFNNNSIIFSNEESCENADCQSVEVANEVILGGKNTKLGNSQFYVNVNTISKTKWKIAVFINIDVLTTTTNQMIMYFIIGIVSVLVVTIIISSYISNFISKPLVQLSKQMKFFGKDNIHEKASVKGQREIVELGKTYNEMVDEITNLLKTVEQEQTEKRRNAFIALQNQINPHFLYNTLDSLLSLNEKGKSKEVEKMVSSLSRFFRLSISTERTIVSVVEELDHIKNYLIIQKLRSSEDINYSIKIDETLLKYSFLKFALQPIVENAIEHGLSAEDDFTKIDIYFYSDANYLYAVVKNEGYGITQEKTTEIRNNLTNKMASKSIGLINVYQRLKLVDANADLLIESVLDHYTTVTIKFPLIVFKEDLN